MTGRPCSLHLPHQGLTLAGLRFGPDEGRPIVLMHGFLDQCLSWSAAAQALASQLRRPVLAFDHRGHGLSDHVPTGGAYHVWDHVADADAVVQQEAERAGHPVDLVGHSMGGTVASLLAATHPDPIRRLAILEGLGPPDRLDQAVPRAADFLRTRTQPRRHPTFGTVSEAAARMRAVDPGLDPTLAQALAARMTRPVTVDDPQVRPEPSPGPLTWTWDCRHRARHPYPFSAALHRRFLQAIAHPTLVLTAERGFRTDDHAERLGALPNATERVIGAVGHMLHRDRPDEVAGCLATFLGD